MTKKEWALLSRALQVMGLNSHTIGYIVESLTFAEYERLNGFINWMIETGRTVGRANYQKVFSDYEIEKALDKI